MWRCPKGYPKSSIFVGSKTMVLKPSSGDLLGIPMTMENPPCFKVKKDLLHPPARYQPGKRGKSPVIHGNFGTASPPGMKSAASLHQEITFSPGMTRIHENSGRKGCAKLRSIRIHQHSWIPVIDIPTSMISPPDALDASESSPFSCWVMRPTILRHVTSPGGPRLLGPRRSNAIYLVYLLQDK